MTVDVVSTRADLCGLAAEWSALCDRSNATIFQRPEWALSWWEHSGSGRLTLLTFRRGRELAGVMPAFIHRWEGHRQVTLLGNGVSDHLDLIGLPECAAEAVRYFDEHRSEWDICDWQEVPATSPLVAAAASSQLQHLVCDHLPCMETSLPASEHDFGDGLPHGLKRNLRRYRERLCAEHEVSFETHRCDGSGELVPALIDLHRLRWQTKGEAGMLAGHENFFSRLTPVLATADLVRIHVLRVDGCPGAMIYQLRYKDRAYGYITGFDPALDRFSPGALILDHAMRRAIAGGARVWDFLRGQERYKFQWGARTLRKVRIRLWHDARHAPSRRISK